MAELKNNRYSNRFDKAAGTYDAYARVQRDMASWLAEWLPEPRRGDALEIGAGTGLFTRCLLPWDGRLEASDLSPSMVRRGAEHFPEISWATRDAGETGADASLDWIFSCSFLQWAENPDMLLETWNRRLRPDGAALCGFFIAGTLTEFHSLPGGEPPFRWRGETEWRALFRRAGFHIERMESKSLPYKYPSALELLRSLHRIGATATPRLSTAQVKRLLEAYESSCPHPDGGVRATWSFCRILARKQTAQDPED